MGDSADSTVFFGLNLKDPEDVDSDDKFVPWKFPDNPKLDADDAISYALGWRPVEYVSKNVDPEGHKRWLENCLSGIDVRKDVQVEFLSHGDGYSPLRFILAIKQSSVHAYEWSVERFEPVANSITLEQWKYTLLEWADRLGIPVELRGEPGWHVFATYG